MNEKLSIKTVANADFFDSILGLLNEGKNVKINIKGKSMHPFLQDRDQVILSPIIPETRLSIGHIVLADYHNKIILHRIIKIKDQNYHLTGDGNLKQIEIVHFSKIKAFVIRAIRENQELNVLDKNAINQAIWHYRLRFFRRIWFKIKKLF